MSTVTERGDAIVARSREMSVDKGSGTDKKVGSQNYKGFVAGVFSGVAKLTGELLLIFLCIFSLRNATFSFTSYLLIIFSIPGISQLTIFSQSATPSTQSKSASKPQTQHASRDLSNASSSPSEKKA